MCFFDNLHFSQGWWKMGRISLPKQISLSLRKRFLSSSHWILEHCNDLINISTRGRGGNTIVSRSNNSSIALCLVPNHVHVCHPASGLMGELLPCVARCWVESVPLKEIWKAGKRQLAKLNSSGSNLEQSQIRFKLWTVNDFKTTSEEYNAKLQVKLSSSLLSHPTNGRCHLRIIFSSFSSGMIFRKFDWNEESVSHV